MTRLYVSDLDGTLLDSGGALSPFTRATLARLLDRGVLFTVASARSAPSIRAVLGGLPLALPVIEMDGAQITDVRTGEHLAVNALPAALAAELVALPAADHVTPMLVCTDGRRDRLLVDRVENAGAAWYLDRLREGGDLRLREETPLAEGLKDQVTGIVHIGRFDPVIALREEIERRHAGEVVFHLDENPYTPGWWWLRVQDRRVSKGNALRQLAELAAVPVADTVVFGDALNDLSMFQTAGRAIAVANAAAEILSAAHEIIGPHDEDSVARRILAGMEGATETPRHHAAGDAGAA